MADQFAKMPGRKRETKTKWASEVTLVRETAETLFVATKTKLIDIAKSSAERLDSDTLIPFEIPKLRRAQTYQNVSGLFDLIGMKPDQCDPCEDHRASSYNDEPAPARHVADFVIQVPRIPQRPSRARRFFAECRAALSTRTAFGMVVFTLLTLICLVIAAIGLKAGAKFLK